MGFELLHFSCKDYNPQGPLGLRTGNAAQGMFFFKVSQRGVKKQDIN
uniref:Uncharacterized protein n=2 Tax=Anguilla anguilla TaxID=7936 RepID=A0A0E9RIL5_ANGAN